jgi:rhomboid protease GluP
LENAHPDQLYERVIAALTAPPKRHGEAVLVAYQPPLAVLEVPGERAGLLLLDATRSSVEETRARVERLVGTNEGQWLAIVAVGGPDELEEALLAVDKAARDPRGLSLFHVNAGGRLKKLSGGLLPALASAVRAAPATPPIPLADIPGLIARGQREREEAVNFFAQLQGRRPYVTIAVIATCVLIYFLDLHWHGQRVWGALIGEAVRAGQPWRLLSALFLHGGEIHLLMNMLALWSFGGFLERVVGWRRFLVLYGASGLAGSLASAFFSDAGSVGASGAIWGLMMAGFALLRARQSVFPARMARQMKQRLVSVLVINIGLSFIPGIDKFAHFGGGAAGFLLMASGLLAPRSVVAVGDEPLAVRLLAPITGFAMALSLATALIVGRPWARPVEDETALLLELPGLARGDVRAGGEPAVGARAGEVGFESERGLDAHDGEVAAAVGGVGHDAVAHDRAGLAGAQGGHVPLSVHLQAARAHHHQQRSVRALGDGDGLGEGRALAGARAALGGDQAVTHPDPDEVVDVRALAAGAAG